MGHSGTAADLTHFLPSAGASPSSSSHFWQWWRCHRCRLHLLRQSFLPFPSASPLPPSLSPLLLPLSSGSDSISICTFFFALLFFWKSPFHFFNHFHIFIRVLFFCGQIFTNLTNRKKQFRHFFMGQCHPSPSPIHPSIHPIQRTHAPQNPPPRSKKEGRARNQRVLGERGWGIPKTNPK